MSSAPARHFSTKPVPAFSQSTKQSEEKPKRCDPRFSSESSKGNVQRNYDFILEKRYREQRELYAKLTGDPDNKELKMLLERYKQKIGEIEARNREREIVGKLRKAEDEAVKNGKQRYFMRKNDVRRAVSASQFRSQQQKGRGAQALKRKGQRVLK